MKASSKTYQIRYNTVSKDNSERWRLIENGDEVLVSDIVVYGHTQTTRDWMPGINDYKWHISCVGHCEVKKGIAYITTVKEDYVVFRHVLKTATYRLLGTLTTVIAAYSMGASIELTSILGIGDFLVKPFIYFIHERLWYKFGKVKK